MEWAAKGGPSMATESGPALSGIWQWSAGMLCRWTRAPMCLKHHRIRPWPCCTIYRSPTGGRPGARGTAAPAGWWHQGMAAGPLATRVCGAPIPWLGQCRETRRGRASAPNIKSQHPDPSLHQPLPALHILASRWGCASSFTWHCWSLQQSRNLGCGRQGCTFLPPDRPGFVQAGEGQIPCPGSL